MSGQGGDGGPPPDGAPEAGRPEAAERGLRRPLFFGRLGYRRRRLMDASRLLPLFGAFLFLLPLLWRPEGLRPSTAAGTVYIFTVWFLLIAIAAILARGLEPVSGGPEEEPETEDAD